MPIKQHGTTAIRSTTHLLPSNCDTTSTSGLTPKSNDSHVVPKCWTSSTLDGLSSIPINLQEDDAVIGRCSRSSTCATNLSIKDVCFIPSSFTRYIPETGGWPLSSVFGRLAGMFHWSFKIWNHEHLSYVLWFKLIYTEHLQCMAGCRSMNLLIKDEQ